ncbi:MAG: FAD-dependent oxidoreductase, partial [Myxococcales bacterium]|nr:FAD-dependent oxidoreductase [Myxococcales bacterium]
MIVGAGIVGAACALALAEAGLEPTILEAGSPGLGTSAEGMGHLLALDHGPEILAMTVDSLRRWHALSPALPPRAEWGGAGTLWLAEDEAQLADAREQAATLAQVGIGVALLDGVALRGLEPCLADDLVGGLRVTDDRWIYAPATAAWMLEQARARGAFVRTGTSVRALVRCDAGERLELAEGIYLYENAPLMALGEAADRRRRSLHAAPVVTYIIDRNVNYTNVCVTRCKFCNFYV